jgi:hypothetical protein
MIDLEWRGATAKSITVIGGEFLEDPNFPAGFSNHRGTIDTKGASYIHLSEIKAGYVDITEDDQVLIDHSQADEVEVDKDVNRVRLENNRISTIAEATGCNSLEVVGGSVDYATVYPRAALFDGVTVTGSNSANGQLTFGGGWEVGSVDVRNVISTRSSGYVVQLGSGAESHSITANGGGGTGGSFYLTMPLDWTVMPLLEPGLRLDGTTGNHGTITRIYFDGTNVRIVGTFDRQPAAADVFTFPVVRTAHVDVHDTAMGTPTNIYEPVNKVDGAQTYVGPASPLAVRKIEVPIPHDNLSTWLVHVNGTIVQIDAVVTTASQYSGSQEFVTIGYTTASGFHQISVDGKCTAPQARQWTLVDYHVQTGTCGAGPSVDTQAALVAEPTDQVQIGFNGGPVPYTTDWPRGFFIFTVAGNP